MEQINKKVWRTPRASPYGSFAEATAQDEPGCAKEFGTGDGHTFLGLDIRCVS